MNKLQGFYELKKTNLPSVPWSKYNNKTVLNSDILWTVRSAVKQGDDLNLPRKVGVKSDEAMEFADNLLNSLTPNDMVLYYPYFIALKSGVIDISKRRTVIEAVKDDLWNLVTYGNKDVTIMFEEDDIKYVGNEHFLYQDELLELIDYCLIIKRRFRHVIEKEKSIMLEWSFACHSNLEKEPIGNPSLVFYEIRAV